MNGRSERLLALDVFRGMTVAGMLLVNNPGTWSAIYPPLAHAHWHGWTPTDLIFPFFLFIVGITTELSLRSRRERGATDADILRQIIRRGALIILLGLLLSAFPFFTWTVIPDNADASFLDRIVHRVENLRITGVLQRIGLAYLVAALVTFKTGWRVQVAVLAVILFGYWALMTLVPVPDSGIAGRFLLDQPPRLLSSWLDRTILGTQHLWVGSRTWDPEGLLSTVPAVGTVLLGSFAGRWIGRTHLSLDHRLVALFSVGSLVMVAGLVWNWWFPINKSIWTSSYVLFTGGMAALTLGTCMWIIDVQRIRGWTEPFVAYGVNPMLAFVGSGVMTRLIVSVFTVERDGGVRTSVQQAIYETFYSTWLPSHAASFAYALTYVLVWYVILRFVWKRGIVFKV